MMALKLARCAWIGIRIDIGTRLHLSSSSMQADADLERMDIVRCACIDIRNGL